MRGARGVVLSASCVLFAWFLAFAIEHVVVGFAFRDFFTGPWEVRVVRRVVLPLALASVVPLVPLVVALGALVHGASDEDDGRRSRVALAAILGTAAGALGYGVSFGRHFASWAMRAPFVAAVAGVGVIAGIWLVPAVARRVLAAPWTLAIVGPLAAAAFWSADLFVLARLYPAMHVALFALTLVSVALVAVPLRVEAERRAHVALVPALIVLLAAAAAVATARVQAANLAPSANVRLALVEHAPLLGRAVLVATALHPPPSIDDDAPAPGAPSPGDVPRALDWSGRDIVLLSVDALRADHVGAYGYARPTTPSIDALAREGTRFERAYCPTPHTSYSITSMMTGKYMRPLLALGLGDDSETWAAALRRYDFRSAAFYPPAVFFIDEARFGAFEKTFLDFEYAKVEFAAPSLRAQQVETYLAGAPTDRPLFLWVHLFEPHEPYVMHPAHPFGGELPTDVDAYDSEIAAADEGIGLIVAAVRARRPGAVVIVTADHGEEFGEHGGRYHGTTVYEEQVRVPLVVVGPGVAARASRTVVQTIDLFPTVLSALGIPRPARVRGRDLGPVLRGADDDGLALAETDDYALFARGADRLVCARRAAACALHRPEIDPTERRDFSSDDRARADDLRRALGVAERDHGRFEAGTQWPEALRRGLQGDVEAAIEVAALLDDASVAVRRKAAEVSFDLHAVSAVSQVRRAVAREEDEETRRWCALSLVRMGEAPTLLAEQLFRVPERAWRRRAALALGEHGDARAADELATWWSDEGPPRGAMEFERARELLAAIARVKARSAVPALVRSLSDVRLRPFVVDALAKVGDPSARAPLLEIFVGERYVSMREGEARALVALGARAELRAALERFAGIPEPMRAALVVARDAGLLEPKSSGLARAQPAAVVDAVLTLAPSSRPRRLLVLTESAGVLEGTVGGSAIARPTSLDLDAPRGTLHVIELGPMNAGAVAVHLTHAAGAIAALWIVPRADEIPPPPAMAWGASDAGAASP